MGVVVHVAELRRTGPGDVGGYLRREQAKRNVV